MVLGRQAPRPCPPIAYRDNFGIKCPPPTSERIWNGRFNAFRPLPRNKAGQRKRRKLLRVLQDPTVIRIVVEHRDRLARFGFDLLEAAMAASGRHVVVVEEGEVTDDLVQDVLEILTSACGRLYGRRSAKRRAQQALETMGCK